MKKAVIVLLVFTYGLTVYAQQESPSSNNNGDYQRYSLNREKFEFQLETRIKYWAEDIQNKTYYSLIYGLDLGFRFFYNHQINANINNTIAYYDSYQSNSKLFYSPNEIILSYDYYIQIKMINLILGSYLTIPLGINNEYAQREGVLNSGSDRYITGTSIAVSGVRDPVVWNIDLKYGVGLPKDKRFYTSFLPGIIQLSAGFLHLLNERFGLSFGLQQNFILPEKRNGLTVNDSFRYAINIPIEAIILFENDFIRVIVDFSIFPANQPMVISFIYAHRF